MDHSVQIFDPQAAGKLHRYWRVTSFGCSVALLLLVLVAILLDARDAQAGHSAAVDRALPAGEFLEAERVALARFVDCQEPAGDGGDDLRLAANDPARGGDRRQRIERQRLAERSNDLGRTNLLVLEHSRYTCLIIATAPRFNRRA